jgi:hypothetical protein
MAPQLTYQSELAMRSGIKREELMEVVIRASAFTGFAVAVICMSIIEHAAESLKSSPKKA